VKGIGFADAPPTFKVKTIEVYEKGTHRKVATLANPKLQEQDTNWGQKTQTYRIEVPKKNLDLKKEYTFVVTTGINGSKPQQVRSAYVPIKKVF
jgi:hypothetical protein